MMALGIICDFASLRACTGCQMPDWLSWGNVGSRCLQQTSRAQGKRSDWSPECGRARWGRLVSRSMSNAGDVNEDGRILRYENGECESPAWMDFVTPWWNWKVIIEDRTWISDVWMLWICWKMFEMICEYIRHTPASESHAGVRQFYQDRTNCILCMYKITWLKCILWGTRFPPTLCSWCGRGRSLLCE